MKQFDSKAMILDPDRWPVWPMLPLKKPGETDESGFPALGVLIDKVGHYKPDGAISVFHTMMFDRRPVDEIKRTDYPSVDALLADGWVVD